jgi:hypothetical protein
MERKTQVAEQVESGRYRGRFMPGQSGNPRGGLSLAERRARISATAHELAVELGGFENLGAIEQTLIMKAAEHLHRRPRDPIAISRRDNLVSRILRDCLRRHQLNKMPGRTGLGSLLRTP